MNVLRWLPAALLLGILGGCALGGAPAWEQEVPPIRTGPVVDETRLHRGELSNGLTLLVFEDARHGSCFLALVLENEDPLTTEWRDHVVYPQIVAHSTARAVPA